jgi:hypothetical protein
MAPEALGVDFMGRTWDTEQDGNQDCLQQQATQAFGRKGKPSRPQGSALPGVSTIEVTTVTTDES